MASADLAVQDGRERSIRAEVQEELRRVLDGDDLAERGPEEVERARQVIETRIAAAQRQATTLGQPPIADPRGLERRLLDDLLGFGALQPLLDDRAIEIGRASCRERVSIDV